VKAPPTIVDPEGIPMPTQKTAAKKAPAKTVPAKKVAAKKAPAKPPAPPKKAATPKLKGRLKPGADIIKSS
jgi:hypothetical protein